MRCLNSASGHKKNFNLFNKYKLPYLFPINVHVFLNVPLQLTTPLLEITYLINISKAHTNRQPHLSWTCIRKIAAMICFTHKKSVYDNS